MLGAKEKQRKDGRRKNRAFNTLRVRGHPQFQRRRNFCEGSHGLWAFPRLREESVEEKWRVAKDRKLCFRYLSSNHQGEHCFRSRDCAVDGYKRSHHKLLHLSEDVTNRAESVGDANILIISSPSQRVIAYENTAGDTEQGAEERLQITTLMSAQYKEVVSLRTVSDWLKSKGKKMKVNAVLVDASTVSYLNEEVAGALGLSDTYGKLDISTGARFRSDTMNVLYWIRGKGKQYLPFVANRAGEIQSQSNPEQWEYVETDKNTADLCSRGLSASRLKDTTLWWRGPNFLMKHMSEWPKAKI